MDQLRKGDILISGQGVGEFVGHAALMATDEWVLEMPGVGDTEESNGSSGSSGSSGSWSGWFVGSSRSMFGIRSNNRRINKRAWCRLHRNDTVNVWRNKNSDVANDAADWAYRRYWNASGGSDKTQHITYKFPSDSTTIDPTYCSKLVIHSFHYGTGDRKVINTDTLFSPSLFRVISPIMIPVYFESPYRLQHVCTF